MECALANGESRCRASEQRVPWGSNNKKSKGNTDEMEEIGADVNCPLKSRTRPIVAAPSTTETLGPCARNSCSYPRKVSGGADEKFTIFGKMLGRLAALTPNHCANVAPYCVTAVVGISVPRLLASWSLPKARDGKVP